MSARSLSSSCGVATSEGVWCSATGRGPSGSFDSLCDETADGAEAELELGLIDVIADRLEVVHAGNGFGDGVWVHEQSPHFVLRGIKSVAAANLHVRLLREAALGCGAYGCAYLGLHNNQGIEQRDYRNGMQKVQMAQPDKKKYCAHPLVYAIRFGARSV